MSRVLLVPEPGQLVDVRHRRYVVVEVTPSTLPLPVLHSGTLDRQHLVTLSSVEDDALSEDLQVIWEVEPGAATIEKTPLPQLIGFDSPQHLDTFLNAVRWGAASSADVKAIQAPFRSGVDLEDYQLDPVARHIVDPEAHYPGIRYILLHTFAHALMRQLTLECGYSGASIRERIYAQGAEHADGPMAGILLYTAAADSEGTLGGLVSLGKPEPLGWHIDGALAEMKHCASDPLCAEHEGREDSTLHEAACHACMFIPETSCERGNKYLDAGRDGEKR